MERHPFVVHEVGGDEVADGCDVDGQQARLEGDGGRTMAVEQAPQPNPDPGYLMVVASVLPPRRRKPQTFDWPWPPAAMGGAISHDRRRSSQPDHLPTIP